MHVKGGLYRAPRKGRTEGKRDGTRAVGDEEKGEWKRFGKGEGKRDVKRRGKRGDEEGDEAWEDTRGKRWEEVCVLVRHACSLGKDGFRV